MNHTVKTVLEMTLITAIMFTFAVVLEHVMNSVL